MEIAYRGDRRADAEVEAAHGLGQNMECQRREAEEEVSRRARDGSRVTWFERVTVERTGDIQRDEDRTGWAWRAAGVVAVDATAALEGADAVVAKLVEVAAAAW